MHTPSDPHISTKTEREASWARAAVDAQRVAPLPRDSTAPKVSLKADWRSDIPAARAVVKHTLSLGALASGLIEYTGWQIAHRSGAPTGVVPLGDWATGALSNLGGAAAIGLGCACIAMVVAGSHKRPLRAGAAAFAFGVAGFLGFLAFLVSRAF
jgi:hypothetical protein